MYRADPTLYLNVAPGGSKSWIQRLTIRGKRHDIGLGSFELVTMAEARDKAFQNRRLVQAGGNPLAEKRKARVPTFREAAEATFSANRPRWRNAKVASNWMQQLERHAFPRLGDMQVDEIGREDVLAVLTPIWTTKPEVGRKVRQRIRVTLRWAEAHGHVQTNIAGEGIDGALPRQPAVRQHFRALHHREVAAALETVEVSGASLASKLCFRFLVLTAARRGAARRGARRGVGRDRPGGAGVGYSCPAHEGRPAAPRPPVRRGDGSAGESSTAQWGSGPGLPIATIAGPSAVGHVADQDSANDRSCRKNRGSRFSVELSILVRRFR